MAIKGIIFDMDNTLLRSKINFELMKQDVFHFLLSGAILPHDFPLKNETTATTIQKAISTGQMTEALLHEMWKIAKKHEVEGMRGADLEPGVLDLLQRLHGRYRLAVVTNNSNEAAVAALSDNRIYHYFDLVVGRENMTHLKPSPAGFTYVLRHFRDIAVHEWISVGDAWIDAKASMDAGIPFVAYRPDLAKMKEAGIQLPWRLTHMMDLVDILATA